MSWPVLLLIALLGAAPPDAGASGARVEGTASGGAAAALLSMVDATAREVSALRRIPFGPKEKLVTSVVGRAEAREHLTAMLKRQLAPGELEMETRTLESLGLLPRGVDFLGLMVDAAVQEMAGFYDPSSHRLFVADWVPAEQQRPVLAHEIEHALQDRRFGLEKLLGLGNGRPMDSDAQLALQALAEGDASAVMMEFLDPDGLFGGARALAGALRHASETASGGGLPRYLRETMAFPYLDGLNFVLRVRSRRPWSAVDALWRRPPESTEQILHPGKYDCRESPVSIEPVELDLGADARQLGADTLGELTIRIWLSEASSRTVAERAAAGWGGDRVVAYDVAGSTVLAWLTAWDSDADAADFAAAAAESLRRMSPSGTPGGAVQLDGPVSFAGRDGRPLHGLYRQGTKVALVTGGPPALDRALLRVLHDWKVSRPVPASSCVSDEPQTPPAPRRRSRS